MNPPLHNHDSHSQEEMRTELDFAISSKVEVQSENNSISNFIHSDVYPKFIEEHEKETQPKADNLLF